MSAKMTRLKLQIQIKHTTATVVMTSAANSFPLQILNLKIVNQCVNSEEYQSSLEMSFPAIKPRIYLHSSSIL
ncbi:Hypothetical predicted protein [Octopus vulgaris]|uniref:Uncharacterized protein n=1 Tax=Octopus vulgaris TaxID=6645 RepID=A0AA36F4P7_OCTVU|nr:Hypothetical predicted protein [Octopus vulgaris]